MILRSYKITLLVSLSFFLFIDIFFGRFLLQLINAPGAFKSYGLRIPHERYHHTLSPNYRGTDEWGIPYPYCTDSRGFRADCRVKSQLDRKIDYALMGDSMVEGLGVAYQETISGLLADFTSKKVVNLAVSSYSPSIHLEKYKNFLHQGLEINRIIIFFDISDIDDELNVYVKESDGRVVDRKARSEWSSFERTLRHWIEHLIPLTWRGLSVLKKALKDIGRPNAEPWSLKNDRESTRAGWTYLYHERDAAFQAAIVKGFTTAAESLEELVAIAKKHDTDIYLVLCPWPHQIAFESENQSMIEDLIISRFAASSVQIINLFPAFRDERRKFGSEEVIRKFFISGDTHFTSAGHEFVVRQILARLPRD